MPKFFKDVDIISTTWKEDNGHWTNISPIVETHVRHIATFFILMSITSPHVHIFSFECRA